MFKLIKWIIIFALFFLGFSYYQKVSALSCIATTPQQSVSSASSIFVGKVLSVDTEKATFAVSKYWKGNISQTQTIYGATYWTGLPGGSIFFKVGENYIVYTYKDANGIERASIDCGSTRVYSDLELSNVTNILGSGTSFPISIPNPILPIYKPYCEYVKNIDVNLWRGNYFNNRNKTIALQKFLQTYYNTDKVFVNGSYGRMTQYYVTKFQEEMGIRASGGVGPVTRFKMQNLCGPIYPIDPLPNVAPANCKVWYDGCNTCSRGSVGAPMMCTLMACIQGYPDSQMPKPYCREYFSTNTNESPTIKSFTGPVTLNTSEKGIWKIDASIFNNQPLTYNITWGDENQILQNSPTFKFTNSESLAFVQNTTFEHMYNRAGKYTVTIEVKAENGQTTKTTSTVNVKDLVVQTDPEKNGQCKVWTDGYGAECRRDYVNGPVSDCVSWRARYIYFPNLTPVCKEYFPQTSIY